MRWLLSAVILLPGVSVAHPWGPAETSRSLSQRVDPPEGFTRLDLPPKSFGRWLRDLPVLPGRPPVLLHTGRRKGNQRAHHVVFDIDVGRRDLQQCADAVIRLRAEYLWARRDRRSICFRYTNGEPIAWRRWAKGWRPRVTGRRVTWRRGRSDRTYEAFRRYLTNVFVYAGTASLAQEMRPVRDPANVMPGDAFVKGGFPGHVVIVVDVAANAGGERVFLLAQSYMPAQQIHVLRNPRGDGSPWYRLPEGPKLVTPEWTFEVSALKRFRSTACHARATR